MLVHDWLGGRLSVHDRLGERVGYFPRNQEELEEMANAWVPDEFIFCRDANTHRIESRFAIS
jgi:predicted AAA+ superfamily ATPase